MCVCVYIKCDAKSALIMKITEFCTQKLEKKNFKGVKPLKNEFHLPDHDLNLHRHV